MQSGMPKAMELRSVNKKLKNTKAAHAFPLMGAYARLGFVLRACFGNVYSVGIDVKGGAEKSDQLIFYVFIFTAVTYDANACNFGGGAA